MRKPGGISCLSGCTMQFSNCLLLPEALECLLFCNHPFVQWRNSRSEKASRRTGQLQGAGEGGRIQDLQKHLLQEPQSFRQVRLLLYLSMGASKVIPYKLH